MGAKFTTLQALLLFLADHKSGYDLRVLFQSTPLSIFSDSPGAIYPALSKLEQTGLLEGVALASKRRRRIYSRTAAGDAALIQWLNAPVDADVVARRPHELDLRYVLIAFRLGRRDAVRFLDRMRQAFEHRVAELIEYRDSNPGMGAPSIDAVDLGLRLFQTRIKWCRDMQRRWEKE
jgi:DNA-binding PadR family transcriptional regulator